MPNILLVENHPESAKFLEMDLKEAGHTLVPVITEDGKKVTYAENADEALRALKKHGQNVDLVLMEVSMNGNRNAGYEITRQIRDAGHKVPILLHSMATTPERVREMKIASLANGAQDFINKGSYEPLMEAIDNQLGAAHGPRR